MHSSSIVFGASVSDIFQLDEDSDSIAAMVQRANDGRDALPVDKVWAALSVVFGRVGIEPLQYVLGLREGYSAGGQRYAYLMPDEVRIVAQRLEHSHIHELVAAECDPNMLALIYPDTTGNYWAMADRCARLIQYVELLRSCFRSAANENQAIVVAIPQSVYSSTPASRDTAAAMCA